MRESVVFYRKTESGEFEPVRAWDPEFDDSMPIGSHLVTVTKKGRCSRYHINPDTVSLLAAAEALHNDLTAKVFESMSLVPSSGPKISNEQRALIRQLNESGINDYYRRSAHDVADHIFQLLIEKAAPTTDLPWVKDAYEKYLAALALAHNDNITNDDY